METNDIQRLFEQYNVEYFNGRLPRYTVVQAEIEGYDQYFHEQGVGIAGMAFRRERIIQLSPGLDDLELRETLVHEMAHAATGNRHDPSWRNEMRRLRELGATTESGLVYTTGRKDQLDSIEQAGYDLGHERFWEGYRQGIRTDKRLSEKKMKRAFLSGVEYRNQTQRYQTVK